MKRLGRGAGLAAGLLAIAAVLTACSSNGALRQAESRLDELPGVTGSHMWTSFDGSPTNRSLSARVYVDADPGEDLGALIDAGLETAWSFTGFEPTAGVIFEVVVGPRPEKPSNSDWDGRVVLEEALPEIGLDEDDIGVLPSFGDVVPVPARVMVERYGDWPSSGN